MKKKSTFSTMDELIFDDKRSLLKALEARRPWAKKQDTLAIKRLRLAEQKALKDYRVKAMRIIYILQKTMKLDYGTLKSKWSASREMIRQITYGFGAGEGPPSKESMLDNYMRIVRTDSRRVYKITWAKDANLYLLLTRGKTPTNGFKNVGA